VGTHRRIEITAFRRRVTITSGAAYCGEHLSSTDEGVSVKDVDSGESIEFESAEGQLILADAVRSLERRLSPEARGAAGVMLSPPPTRSSSRNGFCVMLQFFCRLFHNKAARFRKEK